MNEHNPNSNLNPNSNVQEEEEEEEEFGTPPNIGLNPGPYDYLLDLGITALKRVARDNRVRGFSSFRSHNKDILARRIIDTLQLRHNESLYYLHVNGE